MERDRRKWIWVLAGVAVLATAAAVLTQVLSRRASDPITRVREALVDEFAMEQLPDEQEFKMGPGWEEVGFLSRQSPAATRKDVEAKIIAACSDCVVEDYWGDAFFVTHESFLRSDAGPGGGPGYSRFLLVTWEGPLGNEVDGGLVLADVWATETRER